MAVAYEENPLTVHCESCGGAANYDIVIQSYRCPYYGGTTSVKGAKAQAKGWRDARQVQFREHARDLAQATYTCPNCAAKVVVPEGEALAACSFCGGKPVRSEFLDDDSFPEVVIGFKITLDEARARLERWCEENARCKPETDGIRKNIGKLDAMEPFDWTECAPFDFGYWPASASNCKIFRRIGSKGASNERSSRGTAPW